MLKNKVKTKRDMYKRLIAGEFGNTIVQFTDMFQWMRSDEFRRYDYWGVRSMVPGGPCYLNVHYIDVPDKVGKLRDLGIGYNISIMIDKVTTVTLWAEILWDASGCVLRGVEYPTAKLPAGTDWRQGMPSYASEWHGTAAVARLRRHLNPNSYDDLMILADNYPEHVIEMSACEDCIGTVKGRNGVVWEVRDY